MDIQSTIWLQNKFIRCKSDYSYPKMNFWDPLVATINSLMLVIAELGRGPSCCDHDDLREVNFHKSQAKHAKREYSIQVACFWIKRLQLLAQNYYVRPEICAIISQSFALLNFLPSDPPSTMSEDEMRLGFQNRTGGQWKSSPMPMQLTDHGVLKK